MGNYLILSGRKGITDLINNNLLNYLIEIVYLSSSQKYLIELCRNKKIRFELKEKNFFKKYKSKHKYQYAIALIKAKKPLTLEELINKCSSKERALIIALDHLQDPFNVGAILRTCCAAGVDGIIIPKNKQAPLNHELTIKASQGYSLHIDLVEVSNLATAIEKLKNNNFWIYSADINENAKSYREVKYANKSILIMGSEGEGISPLISKKTDVNIYIPMENKVNSLNVSVAAGVLVFEILKKVPHTF
ncbi:23S rRNA (guanosine(2251)-2'-O)-methyltransferase RlmB [Candidatus Mycoplasma haematobovis]|uniref:23S rRNA (Guanosine(2251)-2'-O)-methyltransferase RlmB n=1 Tax=Candidatus Mycoplasma haematobovis TaxID=432608 RepID=A0A1A9QEA6_9MOLU|nr:23S rRNA (guanosine(2251)-2'-O)-methyltransferase RlmB [Candidatus Mycoplasma haematobovis]OAL10295.1 23S rRNA (guanosine(2251)-2'-O)-methyltransferase RlmB [Candidatus Mycoplasma haematobovis]